MQASGKANTIQAQRAKLASSYQQLLDEFNAKELRIVGNYSLGKLIGKGSFGKVYLATHKLTRGSKVVLKSTSKDDPNLVREIHHHRQFTHPHIARLYEVIVTESLVWLVLEYCPGDELYNHLSKTGPMEPEQVQRIFTQLVGAVSYVHAKSCVHRDLKLENILLDKHGNVKLVDFGFTREYEGRASYLQTWCGTVCYSAPEMIKGEKYAGEKVDVWSLGIILYALLCGELPFDDDNENVIKSKILKEEPNFPDSIPLPAKELISQLLSKRPILRPTLADILQNPWLSEHAPQQQAILKLQQPPAFTTDLEKEVLQKMKSAGVDIDAVIENVLAQRCDALAGWWALLHEREERKIKRRDRKRKEAEAKGIRRLSAASSRFAPTIQELDEHGLQVPKIGDPPKSRGRNMNRRSINAAIATELPNLPEALAASTGAELFSSPLQLDLESVRSMSTSRPPVVKENYTPSRPSQLQVSQNQEELRGTPDFDMQQSGKKLLHPFWSQFAQIKRWFKQSGKKSKANAELRQGVLKSAQLPTTHSRRVSRISNSSTYRYSNSHMKPDVYRQFSGNGPPTARVSLSPSPLTPRSLSYRRTSGLRGRQSTSSSVSSIRSSHHHQQQQHSMSKHSSTSSGHTSLASPSASASSKYGTRSPHTSVKISPATPVLGTFSPTFGKKSLNINTELGNAFASVPPPSPGIMFAKRKRSPFKGPTLSFGTTGKSRQGDTVSRSSSSTNKRLSGELVIQEEDEEEEEIDVDDEEDVEIVDEFGPVRPGEEVINV